MIPLPYLRLAGVAALAGLLLWAGWVVADWRSDAHQLSAVQAQLSAERAARTREIALAAKATKDYHDELETLRARPAVGPVRLCRAAAVNPSPPPGRTDDPAAASGVGLQGAQGGYSEGPDISGDLDRIAQRCDEVTAQLRALQGWEIEAEKQP